MHSPARAGKLEAVRKRAVRAYSKEFLTGHGYAAYKRLSRRCRELEGLLEGLALAAKETWVFPNRDI